MTPRSRPREIACQLSATLAVYLTGKMDDDDLVGRLRRLADRVEGSKVLQPVQRAPNTVDDENALFAYWQRRMMKPQTKFGSARREKLRARMRDGYTVAQIEQAIDACAASDFHMGENDRKTVHNDLTLICRSVEQFEKFLEMRGGQDHTHDQSTQLTRLQEEAAEALQRGDMDAYHLANTRIRDEQRS